MDGFIGFDFGVVIVLEFRLLVFWVLVMIVVMEGEDLFFCM